MFEKLFGKPSGLDVINGETTLGKTSDNVICIPIVLDDLLKARSGVSTVILYVET